MNIDLSPIMQAVEDVIARHDRYIAYGKAREARKAMRVAQKSFAIKKACQDVRIESSKFPWPASLVFCAMVSGKIGAIRSTDSTLFCTDKPELNPARLRAHNRVSRATMACVNVKGESVLDVSGLIDCMNSEIKGVTLK